MRILQAYKVYRPEIDGGIPEVMSQLSLLAEQGDSVRILVSRVRGMGRTMVVDGTPVEATGSFGQLLSMPISPCYPFALKSAARDCDVLGLHAPFPLNDIGLMLGVPARVAVVIHWHAEILGRSAVMPLLAPFIRRALIRADRIIVSDQSIIEGSAFLKPFRTKCNVIPYGIDTTYWATLNDTQRRAVDVLRANHPRLVVATGRLVSYKGFGVLIEAFRQINGELVIIGEGKERDRLTELARTSNVADRVLFKGFLPRDDIKTYLHAAQLFAFPSISKAEAFGIVQIEAMAAGLPVVTTWLPTAVPTIARDGIEGFTVTPGSPRELADAINRLLGDPDLRARMAAAATQRCESEYSREVFLGRVRQVYVDALNDRITLDH